MEEVKIIAASETYPLRLAILWPHFDRLDQCGIDVDEVEGTFHVGAFKDGEVVSIGTFLVQKNEKFESEKQYRLRAMASSPKVRGQNFGKKVIDFGVEELKSRNIETLWCDARKVALGFYEKMGFTIIGDYYDVPKIGPHKLMFYSII